MAARRADTAVWLHNKLSSDDTWSGSSLRSSLTQDVVRNIPECFHRLETAVKIKLMMAFLHLPRRVVEETSAEITEILEIASADEDEWVRVLAEALKYYPNTGVLNIYLEHVSPVIAEVTQEIRKTVGALSGSSSSLLPLESQYLNRSALLAMVGQQPPLTKHFTLRRKPKSATLRAELTQKASEVISTHKKGLGTPSGSSHKAHSSPKKFEAPVRVIPRVSNSMSYRPTPNKPASSGSSRSIISAATLKHHGRTKLLDINEQPIGCGREVKRRKRPTEPEQGEEAKQRKVEAQKNPEPAAPDYAAGLTLTPASRAEPRSPEKPSSSTSPSTSSTAASQAPTQSKVTTPQAVTADTLGESTINLKRELEMHMEQQRQLIIRERQQKQKTASAAAALTNTSSVAGSSVLATPRPTSAAAAAADSTTSPSTSMPSSGATQQQQQQQQQQQKRQLTLTREQMLAAHEMFRNANRVSRAEKALILGFMAGARDKPYAYPGPIITIKLSENTENVTGSDGTQQTLLVEMLFEMNYDSGHWRRLKRTRVISKNGASNQAQKNS